MIDARNLWELLEKRAEATPDAAMAVDENGRALTFAEYQAEAERAAAGLARLGIGAGDVVSWQLPTWLESIVLVSALSRLGAVQNPMLPIYRQREVGFITKQAGSRLLVVPGTWRNFDYEEMAREIASGQPGLEILVANRALPQGDPQQLPPPPDPPDVAADLPVRWYYYTSGTTADPKGAQHTDATIRAAAVGMCERLEVTESDRIGCVFPFTHVAGAVYIFSALAFGCTMIVVEGFDPESTPPVLAQNEVTLAGAGTPFHMAYLAYQRNHPEVAPLFPKARAYIGGGAPKPPQLHYDVKFELGGVGVVSGYGMTEAPIVTMASVRDDDETLANTEGAAVSGVELITVKIDGSRSSAGEEGEIRVRAPMLMRGYIDSSLDAEAFDENGYFRTGDLAVLDERGNVRITGRVKDIIIRNMENISAKELEDNLFTHPKVADVAVVGLPDERTGERACAVVVPAEAADPPALDELCAYLLDRGLMKQKLPEQLEIVDALPRNPTGKIVKFELRDRVREAMTAVADARVIDLLDGDFYSGDPYPTYEWLRENAPVYRDEVNELWGISRHADVVHVSRHPELFCSGEGFRPKTPPDGSMISQDDPRHTRQRRLVYKGFTPKQVAGMEAHTRAIVTEILDTVIAVGRCDFTQDIAVPLPMIVIAEMLGVKVEDRDRLQAWSDELIKGADGKVTDEIIAQFADFCTYITEVIEDRRVNPRDDLTSILTHAEIVDDDGERHAFTLDALINELLLILVGGNETTRNVISGGMEALLAHPSQRQMLRDDPALLPVAIEEMLRWVTPIVNFQRTTTTDVEVAGVPIAGGQKLLLLYGSANRDPSVFGPTAADFDIRRDPNPHIAFGFGTHFCLGASLARLEIRVMYEELLRRLPDIELAPGASVQRTPSSFIRGIHSMPVEFTPT